MLQDSIEIVINHISCYVYKLCVAGRPTIPSPAKKYNSFEVYGMNGSFYDSYGYEDIEYSLTLNYLEEILDNSSFKFNFRMIKKWLYSGTRLEFSDEPDVYYEIKKVEIGEATNDIVEYGSFEVKFTLSPFARVIENSPLTFEKSAADLEVSLNNISVIDSEPIISLYGNGDAALYLNSEDPVQFKGIEESITMDSERKLTYRVKDGVNTNQSDKQSSNGYLKLIPDQNQLIVTGKGITKVEVWLNSLA